MAEFTGPNLRQPNAAPFPSVAPLAPVPQFGDLGKAIAGEVEDRKAAAAAKEESSVFAQVVEEQTEAVTNFLNEGTPSNPDGEATAFDEATNADRAAAIQNPGVKSALGSVERIRQARAQARTPEDFERLYLKAADINKRIVNDHPQFADVVLKASQAALGFDPLEKAVGLRQSELIKQQELEAAQRKTLIERATGAGVVDIRSDGTFDEPDAIRKGQALLQQDELLKRGKERAELLEKSKPSEAELRRSKFSAYSTSVLPIVKTQLASFGANLINNFAELENDPSSAAVIQRLWSEKRAAFLANQELKIAEIDDPTVQEDARRLINAQLKPYDDLYTGDFSTLARNKRRLDNLQAQTNLELHETAPIVARMGLLGDQISEAVLAKTSASDPAFYDRVVSEVTGFASGSSGAPTARQDITNFIDVAEGTKPLASMTSNEARGVIKHATNSINALANNPNSVDERGLAAYATLATQLAATADSTALPPEQLARAVDTLSSPNKLRLFDRLAASGAPKEQLAELAGGIERVNQKNFNAQAQALREVATAPSSPQFQARFGFAFEGGSVKPVFNPASGRVELERQGGVAIPRELQARITSINNSLDAITHMAPHTGGTRGFDDLQTRQVLADTAGIETRGQRVELPSAPAPAPAQAPATLAQLPRTPEELTQELIRLGREGNAAGIQALLGTIQRGSGAASAFPVSFTARPVFKDEELDKKVVDTANAVGVDSALFARLVKAESNGNQNARSSAGAVGLTQLIPSTAEELGVDPEDPDENLFGGATYLKRQIDRFGDTRMALAAYNWGPANVAKAVKKYGDEWDQHLPKETENYINRIAPKG